MTSSCPNFAAGILGKALQGAGAGPRPHFLTPQPSPGWVLGSRGGCGELSPRTAPPELEGPRLPPRARFFSAIHG